MRARTWRCDPCGSRVTARSEDPVELDELHAAFRSRHQGHGKGTRPVRPATAQQVRASHREVAYDLCRQLVFMRDEGRCRRCQGTKEDGLVMEWAHVHSRGSRLIAAEPDNSMVLCSGCHYWQSTHSLPGRLFFIEQIGEARFYELERAANAGGHMDWKAVQAWLRQELKRAAA